MEPIYHRIYLRVSIVQFLFSTLLLVCCKSAHAALPDTAFLNKPGVIITDLKEQSLNDLQIPSGTPLSIRKIKDSENPVVLQAEFLIDDKDFIVITSTDCNDIAFLYEKDIRRSSHKWDIKDLYCVNLDGRYYDIAALKERKLAVYPHSDPLGEFYFRKPNPSIEHLEVTGMLKTSHSYLALFEQKDGRPVPPRDYMIPTGDYYPEGLSVTCDEITVDMHTIYEPEIQRVLELNSKSDHRINIRKDTLTEVHFAEKPEVLFVPLNPDQNPFKPGQEIIIQAFLMDPALQMLIVNYRTSVKMERELLGQTIAAYELVGGELQVAERKIPLEHTVKIMRENGDLLVEDTMQYDRAYKWHIPDDIKLSNDEKPWIVTMTWDTGVLYGTVTAQTKVSVVP